jgi:uncharacterized protein
MDLSATEVRVLGCMMEKQLTTPDTYPLTLNSLRLACNQSTNRDPVVSYDDAILRDALHRLERRGYARLASGRGSRAPKYRHLLAEALPLGADEHAALCVLLLRGAQTPGELKQRAERMHAFDGLDAVHDTLARLIARGLVARLARRPGQKEERYEHLLSADDEDESRNGPGQADAGSGGASPHGASHGSTVGVASGSTVGVAISSADDAAAHAGADHGAGARVASGEYEAATHEDGRDPGGLADTASLAALEARVARLEREVAQLRSGSDAGPGPDAGRGDGWARRV